MQIIVTQIREIPVAPSHPTARRQEHFPVNDMPLYHERAGERFHLSQVQGTLNKGGPRRTVGIVGEAGAAPDWRDACSGGAASVPEISAKGGHCERDCSHPRLPDPRPPSQQPRTPAGRAAGSLLAGGGCLTLNSVKASPIGCHACG